MSFKLPAFSELNNTQKTIIQLLPISDKMAVIGGPGTGKTIVALEAAAMMSDTNKKCLILSYSTMLRDYIINIANDYALNMNNIEVNSYHSWFWNELKKFGLNPEDYQKKEYVYDIKKLEEGLNQIDFSKYEKYDYIFIDEAQDVQDGLIKCFYNFCNKILVTFDDSQKIGNEKSSAILDYDHSNILLDLKIGDKFFDLIDNYRNTSQTETAARVIFNSYDTNDITLKKVTARKKGVKPKLLIDESKNYDAIAKYILEHYDSSKSVGIFYSQEQEDHGQFLFELMKNTLVKYMKEYNIDSSKLLYKFGKKKNNNVNSKNALSNSIFLVSLKTSKGLEFDDVYILTDYLTIDNYQKKNLLYVAFTRSKDITNVVITPSEKGDVVALFEENKHLFDCETISA